MTIEQQLRSLGFKPDQIAAATDKRTGRPLGEVDAGPIGHRYNCAKDLITLYVYGTPIGKPRMTQRDRWAKRPAVLRYRDWCDRVRAIAGKLPKAAEVSKLCIIATFEPPKSWPKKRRCAAIGDLHRQKPDFDNVAKAVADCLWPDDDSGIAHCTVTKRWGTAAKVEIEIVTQQ